MLMADNLRVLHVIPGLANSSGPTQALLSLARHQANLGHDVSICHLLGRGTDGGPFDSLQVRLHGFQVRGLRHWGYSPALASYLNAQVLNYDIVHIHSMWLYPNIAACGACIRHGVPYIIRPAGSLEPWAFGFKRIKKALYYHLIERRLLEHAAALHAVSSQEAENVRRFAGDVPVIMIPNGIDLSEYRTIPTRVAARQALGLPLDAPLVLFLSRIHYVKGLDLLGESFARVLAQVPHARLVIVGPDDHEYAQNIKGLYRDLKIAHAVHFLGERRGQEKMAAYAAANVFVLPSRSENFGFVVAESLAAGTPVVVSRNTPWSHVEEVGAGYWVELNPIAFAERILHILAEDERAQSMGQLGRHMIFDNYSWNSIAHQTIASYRTILSRNHQ